MKTLSHIGGFLRVPFAFGAVEERCGIFPVPADGMDLVVVFRIGLALLAGTFVDGALHRFPLLLGDFELLDLQGIEDVAIDHHGLHGGTAVGLERYAAKTADAAGLFVVRAGATTLRAALT